MKHFSDFFKFQTLNARFFSSGIYFGRSFQENVLAMLKSNNMKLHLVVNLICTEYK